MMPHALLPLFCEPCILRAAAETAWKCQHSDVMLIMDEPQTALLPRQESSRTWMTAPRSISIAWERTLHRLATLRRVNGYLHSLYMGNTTGHGGLTVEASPWKAASALEMRDFWDTWRKDHPWKRGMIWRWLSTRQGVVSTELDESTMLIYEHGSVLRRHRGRRWGGVVTRKCRLWRQTCPSFRAQQLCHRMEGVIVLALHCPQPKSRCGLL